MSDGQNVTGTLENQNQSESGQKSIADVVGVTQENITFAVTRDLKNPKAALGFSEYKEGNATYKAANPGKDKDGNDLQPEIEVLKTVTVAYPVVHSISGISEIMGTEEEEAVSIFNTGAFNKLKSQCRAKFTATNDAGDFVNSETEVDYDEASEIISSPLKRRNLTDVEKIMRSLKGVDPNALQAALAAMGIVQ